jgi:hypothetical protein
MVPSVNSFVPMKVIWPLEQLILKVWNALHIHIPESGCGVFQCWT